ncbi:hypothetical protein HYW59_01495 [Candidatus Kaiserbacteria bacterium]|nr:hypothetical protein [Candidatus Kaiserbacteria bacterium]
MNLEERPKKRSIGEKLRAAALGAAALSGAAATDSVTSKGAEAQTILQYTHEQGQDPRIASLPKDTTMFQTAGRGQVNVIDGATLDPKITHIYQTTRGGVNIIKNKNKIRPDVVIIQEGGSNVISDGDANNMITRGRGSNIIGDGNIINGR